jgi:hypothetical protein
MNRSSFNQPRNSTIQSQRQINPPIGQIPKSFKESLIELIGEITNTIGIFKTKPPNDPLRLIENSMGTERPTLVSKILGLRDMKNNSNMIKFIFDLNNSLYYIITGITYIEGYNLNNKQLKAICKIVKNSGVFKENFSETLERTKLINGLFNNKSLYNETNIKNNSQYQTIMSTTQVTNNKNNNRNNNTNNTELKNNALLLEYLFNIIDITISRNQSRTPKQYGVTGNYGWGSSKNGGFGLTKREVPNPATDPIGYIICIYGYLNDRWFMPKNIQYVKKYLRFAINNPNIKYSVLYKYIDEDLKSILNKKVGFGALKSGIGSLGTSIGSMIPQSPTNVRR